LEIRKDNEIKIRNSAGILKLNIKDEIPLEHAGRQGLGSFENCRLEFHKRYNGDLLITLYDQTGFNNLDFIVINIDDFGDAQIFEATAESDEIEELLFETVKYKD
jgi:hypothetical protein